MKITIYELLGLVKDGKAPEKIKYNDKIFDYNNTDYRFWDEEYECYGYLTSYIGNNSLNILNDIVEIIEEQKKQTRPLTKKDIEALGYACGEIEKCFTNGWAKSLENKPLEEQKKIPEKINIELNIDD